MPLPFNNLLLLLLLWKSQCRFPLLWPPLGTVRLAALSLLQSQKHQPTTAQTLAIGLSQAPFPSADQHNRVPVTGHTEVLRLLVLMRSIGETSTLRTSHLSDIRRCPRR